MEAQNMHWRRLPLKGAANVRELGGYPIRGGGHTRYRRFLRSGALDLITETDIEFLRDYGVSCVIDLRDEHEVRQAPDEGILESVQYANIPLLGVNLADSDQVRRVFGDREMNVLDLYRVIVENYWCVRDCLNTIAEAPSGCILFHCAVGKDRTGMLSLILLSLAGVDRWDIVSDYMLSRVQLMRDEVYAAGWKDSRRNRYREAMDSAPETAEYVLDVIEREHAGIHAYLRECGLTVETIEAVRRRLIGT